MNLTKFDRVIILLGIGSFVIGLVGFFNIVIAISLLVAFTFAVVMKYINYSKNIIISKQNRIIEEQPLLQDTMTIISILQPRLPLPHFNGWRLYPDMLSKWITILKTKQPNNILELGSGVSTIITGYILENQKGKLYSIDESENYLSETKIMIEQHTITAEIEFYHCPIKRNTAIGKDWYDISNLPDVKFDLVLIDGPSTDKVKEIRYGALPILEKYLAKGCVLLLDDAKREGERSIIQQWKSEFPEFDFQFINTYKGTSEITRLE